MGYVDIFKISITPDIKLSIQVDRKILNNLTENEKERLYNKADEIFELLYKGMERDVSKEE